MDSNARDKCATCGKTRSNVASITQWIMLGDRCSCGAPTEARNVGFNKTDSTSPRNILCARCGGSLSKQDGSLTQWVFRTAPCKCADGGLIAGGATQKNAEAETLPIESDEDLEEIETVTGHFPKDRYRALSLIGSGEQGDVYKAQDRLLKRIVCIKVLRTEKLLPEQAVRFQREAKTGGKLTHPNLTTVLDFGLTEQGQPFLVMEFCPGRSLNEIILEGGALPLRLALKIFWQLCDGMQYAHEHGILHRDLKTANILIADADNENPRVKIIDFGLAGMVLDTIGDTGKFTRGLPIGTPTYMSPEQVEQKLLDQRSDLYSLGCVMFQTLTGKPVFEADSVVDLLDMQMHTRPPLLSETSDIEFPEVLENIVRKLLEKDPVSRFQSIRELKTSLEQLGDANETDSNPTEQAHRDVQEQATSYDNLQEAVLAATNTPTQNKSKSKLLLAVVIVGAVIASASLAVSYIISEDASQGSKDLEVSNLSLADGNWQVVGGNAHGNNAKKIENMLDVTHMKIVDPKFSDSDVTHLQKLNLTVLDLGGTNITDRGLKEVSKIKSLQCLLLNNSRSITDDGMKNLLLPNLCVLSVSGTNVTDRGVETLANIPTLTCLDASNLDKVTVNSIHELSKAPKLQVLRIGNTGITPGELDNLHEIKLLKAVSLANMGLTDLDVDKILKLGALRLLDVSGNKGITAEGIRKLNPIRYWRLTFDNCGLSKDEKRAIDEKAIQDQATPIPIAVDMILPPENNSLGIDREVYSFWYNPKYADPQYFVDAAKKMENVPFPEFGKQ